jgi:hypothetical protein
VLALVGAVQAGPLRAATRCYHGYSTGYGTMLSLETLREAMDNFIAPAMELGLDIHVGAAQVVGPAVALRPIAVFR